MFVTEPLFKLLIFLTAFTYVCNFKIRKLQK